MGEALSLPNKVKRLQQRLHYGKSNLCLQHLYLTYGHGSLLGRVAKLHVFPMIIFPENVHVHDLACSAYDSHAKLDP